MNAVQIRNMVLNRDDWIRLIRYDLSAYRSGKFYWFDMLPHVQNRAYRHAIDLYTSIVIGETDSFIERAWKKYKNSYLKATR